MLLKQSEKPQGRVRPWGFKHNVQSCSLEIRSNIAGLDAELIVQIKDGLGNIEDRPEQADQNLFGCYGRFKYRT